MPLTIAIEPRRSIHAARASGGELSLSGALSHVVFLTPIFPQPITKSVGGALALSGVLTPEASGPSLVTVERSFSGAMAWSGAFSQTVIPGTPIGVSTLDIGGSLSLVGGVVGEVSGPSLVVVPKFITGFIGLGGDVATEIKFPEPVEEIKPKSVDGALTLSGDVATAVSGPSIETLTQSVAGTVTPAGALSTVTIAPPVTTFTKSVGGTITPAGAVSGVKSGPDLITVPKSVAGSLALAGSTVVVIAPTFSTKTQSVSGTITPAGAVARLVSGPSFETKLKSIGGALALSGARSAIVIAPPINFFSQAISGSLGLSGTVARQVSGPSIETKTKSLSSTIVPTSTLGRSVSGPSLVTVPKSVGGSITPTGTRVGVITNSPLILTKAVAGSITPHGARSAIVIEGPVTSDNPLYASMGDWEVSEYDRAPRWPSVVFSGIPSNTAGVKAQFDAMRTRGMKGGIALTVPGQMADRRPDGTLDFNMTKYKALVDRVAAVSGIAGYISGGESAIFCMGDELQHGKWNGTCTPAIRKQMAAYAKLKLPGAKIVVRMPYNNLSGAQLPPGGWDGTLDSGWAQYTGPNRSASAGMTAPEFYADEITRQATLGLTLIMCGINWWNGGDGSSGVAGPRDEGGGGEEFWVMSEAEIKSAADAAIAEPQLKYFMIWTDAVGSGLSGSAGMRTEQAKQSYQDAFLYVKDQGLARGAGSAPKVYFTDTGFYAAPHPAPAIALGKGVRDSLTNHKVFRLVDNARLQDAEYSAFNTDNSVIYYIKGTTGYIAAVTWDVATSSVQVSNERVAVGTSNPAPVIDGWIWSRADRKFAYFVALTSPARLCRREIVLNQTTIIKHFGNDSNYQNFWAGLGHPNTRLSGLHANRIQEVVAAKVHNSDTGAVVGAVAWSATNLKVWNFENPATKVVDRVLIDDSGLYMVAHFTDGYWQVLTLNANGTITRSTLLANGPLRDDAAAIGGDQKMFQGSGLGTKWWDIDPIQAAATASYAHPQRSSKQDLYQQARLSAQYQDTIAYMLYYDTTIATAWQISSGATYKINWATELAARPHKGIPEVVRQGSIQLTKVAIP